MSTSLEQFRTFYIMFRKILLGYAGIARFMCKGALLFLFCALVGLCVVFPLWKFAVTSPTAYTYFVSIIFLLCMLYVIFAKVWSFLTDSGNDRQEKKHRIRFLFLTTLKIVLALFGSVFFIFLLYAGNRSGALLFLLAAVLLYGILSFGSKKL